MALNNLITLWDATADDGTNLSELVMTTSELSISAGVDSLYATGSWTLYGGSSLLESGTFIVGRRIDFEFRTAFGSSVIKKPMCIYKVIGQGGTSARVVPGVFQILLVSPWYFNQKIDSKAYVGRVSDILRQMKDDELAPRQSFNSYNIWDSADDEDSIRWRTLMTPGKFIETRLKQYMKGEDFCPSFIYVDDYNEFNAISIKYISTLTKYKAIPMGLEIGEGSGITPDNIIVFNEIQSSFDGEILWKNINPGITYNYGMIDSAPARKIKTPLEDTLSKITPMLSGKPGYTFVTTNRSFFPEEYSRIITDDSSRPRADVINGLMYHYGHEILSGISINLVCDYCDKNILGKFVNLNLDSDELNEPGNPVSPSIYTHTDWLCSKVSHVFQGVTSRTAVTLTAPSLEEGASSNRKSSNYLKLSGQSPKADSYNSYA